jgi:predicted ATP-grasp superfamily ATP-dependent carboligase
VDEHLLIIGASARAAAFSALRAELRPWCVDLFADADLRAVCPAHRLEGKYPHGFAEWFDRAPPGPWTYTGGLENYPALIGRLAERRPLWGNDEPTLRTVRDPLVFRYGIAAGGLPVPEIRLASDPQPPAGNWLVKPVRGSGGSGIRPYRPKEEIGPGEYLQQVVEGVPSAAVYAIIDRQCHLLGVTRQLVGEPWLHAGPFRYCGSIGPMPLLRRDRALLERRGRSLTYPLQGIEPGPERLQGLFGIDGVWNGDAFWPVEINPRYTASVEVLEYATGLSALAWHRAAFEGGPPPPLPPPGKGVVGKAILFARQRLSFPGDGPWSATNASSLTMPTFADIPDPGQVIDAGRPVLTFFARGGSVGECQAALRAIAADLDRVLFGR